MQAHSAREVTVAPSQQCSRPILGAREKRSDADAQCGVVLAPVAVPAAPHLIDAPLGDSRAELRLVVNDSDLREVLGAPACAAQAAQEIRLLGVDEELLVEEADLVECLATDEQGGRH